MTRYLLTSTLFEGEMAFSYDEGGNLVNFTNDAQLNEMQRTWLKSRFPMGRNDLTLLVHDSKTLTVQLISADLSFAHFWEEYGYKVGHKTRVQKLWDKLPDADKLKALEAIAPYSYYLSTRPNMERLYPETFLSQRRFETDYKALAKGKA
ncbi:hypothetical protein WBJ53_08690 [Spirosoma sp. SC4-14]|uniref:hypothetical protein n=1 Tax=Spirosoma sp. SC4-14 TaxID=3128900 RepID=UPI0030CF940B